MDVRITSVVWEAVADQVRAATDVIERTLSERLSSDYGTQLDVLFVIVSVSDDPAENEKFSRAHTTIGQYERWPSTEKRQLWSLAVEFLKTELEAQTVDEMRRSIGANIAATVCSPKTKPPPTFDYSAFRDDALSALEAVS